MSRHVNPEYTVFNHPIIDQTRYPSHPQCRASTAAALRVPRRTVCLSETFLVQVNTIQDPESTMPSFQRIFDIAPTDAVPRRSVRLQEGLEECIVKLVSRVTSSDPRRRHGLSIDDRDDYGPSSCYLEPCLYSLGLLGVQFVVFSIIFSIFWPGSPVEES